MTKQLRIKPHLISLLMAVICLTLFCLVFLGSSPLRRGNWWPDTNAMLTIGQGWLSGRLPFKDLFEQRGPLLYLYYLLANVLATQGYLGLFVIELLNLIGIWVVEFAIIHLYYPTIADWKSASLALLLPFLLVGSTSFETGGSPEEFAIFWLLLSLYYVIFLLKQQQLSFRQAFIIGVSGGIVFWIKYTLIAPWFAFGIIILITYAQRHQTRQLLFQLGSMLLGSLLVCFIVLIYFQWQHGLSQLWHIYFLTNITAYSNTSSISLGAHLMLVLQMIITAMINQPLILIVGALTCIFLAQDPNTHALLLIISLTMTFNLLLSYWSLHGYPYMFLTTAAIGLCSLPIALNRQLQSKRWATAELFVLVTLFGIAPFATNKIAMSAPFVMTKQPYAPQDFGNYISQHEHRPASLIYFNTLDIGVGRYTKLSHQIKYFEETNLNPKRFPIQRESLNHSVMTAQSQYLVYDLGWSGYRTDLQRPTSIAQIDRQIPRSILQHYHIVNISKTLPIQNNGSVVGDKKNRIFILLKK
ncbi:hypothetical protein [Furfurilactobacillus curtus]|uniref:Glycosyltransferase RgtA/B/C/D-like domain-containing protein n=1 Tax=Furfurilactobacillus curtus TaxID=1746200 RepID=A0ABQ5JP90_9LACO